MSQNYKIVERLQREAELKRAAAMDCYGDRRDTLNREAAEDDHAASLIQELGEALSALRVRSSWCYDTREMHDGNMVDARSDELIAAEAAADAILSKLKEA